MKKRILALVMVSSMLLAACGGSSAPAASSAAPAASSAKEEAAPAEEAKTEEAKTEEAKTEEAAPAEEAASASTEEAAPAETAAVDTVKIGMIWPLTGGSATIGQQHSDGAHDAIEYINAHGGIKSLGGAQVEIVEADSETQPDTGATAAERLITSEGVVMVTGCYNSAVCKPVAERCNTYETPFVSQGGVASAITESGWDWVVRVNNNATNDVQEMIKGIQVVADSINYDASHITYALIYENSDWGADNARIWKEEADKLGWECVVDEPVTNGTSDMSTQIQKIKAANPDVINDSFYTPEMMVFNNALAANKINPPLGVWAVGGGEQDPAFFDAMAPATYEYNFVQEDWNVSGQYNLKWIHDVGEWVKAKHGYNLNSFYAQGWTAAMVCVQGLEAAGSTDKAAIMAALRGLDIPYGEDNYVCLSGYQRIKFDEKGQNIYDGQTTGGTIIQYQNGIQIAVSPVVNATPGYSPIAPIPDDWDTRAANAAEWGTAPEVEVTFEDNGENIFADMF